MGGVGCQVRRDPGGTASEWRAFAYTYKDQQIAQISVTEDGEISSFTGNAGKSERWGAELETQWLPTDNLMLSLSYSYMHGILRNHAPLPGEDGSINTDDLAKRTSPDNMASGIVDWVFARTDWAEFIAHTEVFWQSKGYASPLTSGSYNGQPYVFPTPLSKWDGGRIYVWAWRA